MSKSTVLRPGDSIPTDQSFRLSAGPGAGKSRRLVAHVRQVLRDAPRQRLHRHARVVCLTYTEIGTATLTHRLRDLPHDAPLRISTLHGFLFHELVRPYAHMLQLADLATHQLRDHAQRYASATQLADYLAAIGKTGKLASEVLREPLSQLVWRRRTDRTWYLAFAESTQGSLCEADGTLAYLTSYADQAALLAYKHAFWRKGLVEHEDVIRLACELLHTFPALGCVLASRFPYVFVDEFQDTTVHQLEILHCLATQQGLTMGIIGDPNQSIYEFAGVNPGLSECFLIPNSRRYRLEENHRSTSAIVGVLNSLWGTMSEQKSRAVYSGPKPWVLVGPLPETYAEALKYLLPYQATDTPDTRIEMACMARSNFHVGELLKLQSAGASERWEQVQWEYQDFAQFFEALCSGVTSFLAGHPNKARLALTRLFQGDEPLLPLLSTKLAFTATEKHRVGVALLDAWLTIQRQHPAATLASGYEQLQQALEKLFLQLMPLPPAATELFAALPLAEVQQAVSAQVAKGLVRTIHRFKGDEADAVFVYLPEVANATHLTARLNRSEEKRIVYVALSRARRFLFVAVPRLSEPQLTQLVANGFEVVRVVSGAASDTAWERYLAARIAQLPAPW